MKNFVLNRQKECAKIKTKEFENFSGSRRAIDYCRL